MGQICNYMLVQFTKYNDNDYQSNNFDLWNLKQGIEWARYLLSLKYKVYDSTYAGTINLRDFIKWAKHRIKNKLYLPHIKLNT